MYYVEKTKEINYLKHFDYFLIAAVALLTIYGLVILGSVTNNMIDGPRLMRTQIISFITGFVAAIGLSFFDYKNYKIISILIYIFSVIMLAVVLWKGVGDTSWGSRSWLPFPVIGSFQPSEFAKITFILIVPVFLDRMKESPKIKDTVKMLLYAAIPVILIVLQPDYGMAVVYVFIFAVMIYVYGIKYRYIFILTGAVAVTAPIAWFFLLDTERRSRITEFLFPGNDPLGAGYQLDRARMAIGSGKILGSGLYKGIQTHSETGVPVIQSDFIFTAIGEELGFVGAVILLVLIFCILFRGIYIAKNSRDFYGSFVAIGITSMLGFHFIQNIGMCIGVLPVTGLPLPFVSSGGSAMMTNYFAIGILLSISIRRKRAIFNP